MFRHSLLKALVATSLLGSVPQIWAQNPDMQQKLMEIKQSAAANKQSLARYTWLEQQTTSIKGEVKKTQQFQVRIGPDGQQQKVELNPQAPAEPSGGRLKRHIVAKKTEEFKDYGQQIAELGKQYAQLDPQALDQAYQRGDSLTLVFNRQQKALLSVQVASYLTDPSDAVRIAVQYDKLPDGTNHVASNQVTGVSKQLGVMIQNSSYQPIG